MSSPTVSLAPVGLETAQQRDWKAPIAIDLFALIGVVLGIFASRAGDSTFSLSPGNDAIQLAPITVPAAPVGAGLAVAMIVVAVLAHGFAWFSERRRVPLWLITLFAVLFFVGFLVWAAAGNRAVPVPGLLVGALAISTPLILGALGGVIGERSGVVNVAIEGQLLFGAFSAALVGSVTQNAFIGLLAAMIGAVLVAFVLAVFSIRYVVDQVIVGVVLNVLASGLTGFLYTQLLTSDSERFNSPLRFPSLPIPLLSQIPIVGPVFFRQTIIVYLMYVAVFAVWYALFRTRWGLRTRAIGEHPTAADTVGINVNRMRFWNVALAGAIAGIGGAYFTLDAVGSFGKDMTNGVGFIALAAVIFGRWHPLRATLAGLLFGFATNLQTTLKAIGSPVPSEFMLMLPYLVTIAAVAGLVGTSRQPAADGKPYVKS